MPGHRMAAIPSALERKRALFAGFKVVVRRQVRRSPMSMPLNDQLAGAAMQIVASTSRTLAVIGTERLLLRST